MKRNFIIGTAIFGTAFILLELTLRICGLHNPPIYISNKEFEYILKPNQNISYFFNKIITNSFGQRSDEPKTKSIKIITIGDSVIHGGNPTDQDELATTILSNKLSDVLKTDVQVLNISAGSWGPDNGMAYLNVYGAFNSKILIMVYSSHDLYDIMGTGSIIGNSINHPTEKPILSIVNLFERYIWKDYIIKRNATKTINPPISNNNAQSSENSGFTDLIDFCQQNKIVPLGYLHPTVDELNRHEYANEGKRILEIWKKEGVGYIEGINYMSRSCYRDEIHLNEIGQNELAKVLEPKIIELLGGISL